MRKLYSAILTLVIAVSLGPFDIGALSQAAFARQVPRGIDPSWVYVKRIDRWEAPPAQLEDAPSNGITEFVIFYPSGSFASVSCTVYRRGNGPYSISNGDDFLVAKGTWMRSANGICAAGHLTHAGYAPRTGDGRQRSWAWTRAGAKSGSNSMLASEGGVYERLPANDFTAYNVEKLAELVSDENRP